MGQVWEAEEARLDRRVALKLLAPERSAALDRARFAREARAGARLQHPNLVSTYAYGEEGETTWIAQELVDGAWTLADFLNARRKRATTDRRYFIEVAELVAALADGLHAAHEAGVLHRDVKPANVLLDRRGRPRLADFGLAHLFGESTLTRTGDVAGTWAYMSPEQVRGRLDRLDRRSDVFSLGVVLYELLSLRLPFEGDTAQLTAQRILRHDPPDPRRLRSGCPSDLSTICLKALEKSPDARYATASELAADLRRHLTHESILARRPGLLGRMRRWARRHPAASSGGGLGLLALMIVGRLLVGAIEDARTLERQASETLALTRAARESRNAVLRLADSVASAKLLESQRELWPPHPERLPDFEAWIDTAQALVAGLEQHERDLASVRAGRALPFAGSEEARPSEVRVWWERELAALVVALQHLRDTYLSQGAASLESGWALPDRLRLARELERAHAPGGAHRAAWEQALPAIRSAYAIELEPIVGLLPIGVDPLSGLWEFAHLASGEPPRRDAEGQLVLGPESGIVLVLVPGGASWIGVQSDDPDAPNYEPEPNPVLRGLALERVRFRPSWIAKYELTQAQWRRMTGEAPSAHRSGSESEDDLRPVEFLTFEEARLALLRFGLDLPEGRLWEHAARAGSTGRFSLGREALQRGWINVIDSEAWNTGDEWATGEVVPDFTDGAVVTAPIGTWPPNPWGLHEVHGNVGELTREAAAAGSEPQAVCRGGSFADVPLAAYSYARAPRSTGSRDWKTGLRPIWPLADGGR